MPKRGLHFTYDTAVRYLKDHGLDPSLLYGLSVRQVAGVKTLEVFPAVEVQMLCAQYVNAKPVAAYATRRQRYTASAKRLCKDSYAPPSVPHAVAISENYEDSKVVALCHTRV